MHLYSKSMFTIDRVSANQAHNKRPGHTPSVNKTVVAIIAEGPAQTCPSLTALRNKGLCTSKLKFSLLLCIIKQSLGT